MSRQRSLVVVAGIFAVVVGTKILAGCTTGTPVDTLPTGDGEISGVVFKGAVANATVQAFKLVDGKRGDQVASAMTDAQGAFVLGLGKTKGALLLSATGGTYSDEATPAALTLSGELTTLVPSFSVGTKLEHVTISPISHLAATLALYHASQGTDLAEAVTTARRHIEDHFGGVDWSTVVPTDLTTNPSAQLDQAGKAGLVLAGLSMVARTMAEGAGLTPGAAVNPGSLVAALNDDLAADGFFDGMGTAGPILIQSNVAATKVDGQTPRTALAQAISRFLDSDRNHSGVKSADAYALSKAIAGADDPYLFRTANAVDLDGPTIEWLQPADDSGVHGSTRVYLTAHDPSKVATFVFLEPASLSSIQAKASTDGLDSTLDTVFDVSALPDGPITFKVRAVDSVGNATLQSRTVHVANSAPEISVSYPQDNDVVKGTVTLTASASVKDGTIAKLELRNPPPGVGADELPAADSFAVPWDTTQALEGPAVLTFHAEDLHGAASDVSVSVVVDNVPPGEITVLVSTGAPLAGALVQAVALDDATGLATESRADHGMLGQATTDETGVAKLVLTGENWDGPIQLRASGQGLTYVDPSDGVTRISIPTTTVLSSFIPRYRTGDKITAPVTLWTTLADAGARAVLHGRNPSHPQQMALTAAMKIVDPLFAAHIAPSWDIRAVSPVDVTQPPTQTLRDVVFAALPNVGLNSLARDLSGLARVTPGQVITGITVLNDLVSDVESDGLFDGKGPAGVQLSTLGSPAQDYAPNTTRFDLAMGIDHWLSGSTNATGIARADMLRAGIYDAVTQDRSILYPADAPTHGFDSDPPVVQWQATFLGSDGSAHPPFGATALVSGTVSVVVNATDLNGVNAIAVTAGGTPVTASASSAGHWEGTVDTTAVPDGGLAFVVRATDTLGNAGVTTFTLTVDNTKPKIVFTAPGVGIFVSTSALVDATASDESGVVSLVKTSGFDGLLDSDTAPEHFTGSWTVPAGQADGVATLGLRACDVVTNCQDASVAVKVDRTPPALTLVSATQITNVASATVSVTATDGSGAGVKEIWVQAGNQTPQRATQVQATWVASNFTLPATQKVTVVVWGVDVLGNSGKGRGTPYDINATVTFDWTAPDVFDTGTTAYLSEQGLKLASEAVPASYLYTSSTRLAVSTSAPIYKASSRVSYGATPPTPTSLETFSPTNTNNTPFLKFQVPYDPATESAISAPTYTVAAAGLVTPPPSGTLVGDPTAVQGGHVFFYLPLSKETLFPGGPGSTTTFTFTIAVTTSDAAGNTRTSVFPGSGAYTYTFVAPPLYTTDTTQTYAALKASDSIYGLHFDDASYGRLADGSTRRYARFVVANPSDVPVQISPTLSSPSCSGTETWWASVDAVPSDFVLVNPYMGGSYKAHYMWTWIAPEPDGAFPCHWVPLTGQYEYPYTDITQPSYAFGCMSKALEPVPASEHSTIHFSDAFTVTAYSYTGLVTPENQPLGGPATVPAAANGQPGRIALYVERANSNKLGADLYWATPGWLWPSGMVGSGKYATWKHLDYWKVTPGSNYFEGVQYRWWTTPTHSQFTCGGSVVLDTDANSDFRDFAAPQLTTALTVSATYN